MAEKDVVITYETLYELLRIEKNREDLQKLEPSFFTEVLGYLNDKKANFESKPSQSVLFASDEKDKARLELDNLRKILKELYDRREKKITTIALNKARTGVVLVNTANMLPPEKALFNSLSTVLFEFRRNVLFRLASGELPDLQNLTETVISKLNNPSVSTAFPEEPAIEEPSALPDEPSQDVPDAPSPLFGQSDSTPAEPSTPSPQYPTSNTSSDTIENPSTDPTEAPEQPKELKTSPSLSDSGVNTKKVRFLAPIGEIVGPDLKIYGPYEEGAVISLPGELARVLLEKQQAEEVAN
jgi:hypothetical protein